MLRGMRRAIGGGAVALLALTGCTSAPPAATPSRVHSTGASVMSSAIAFRNASETYAKYFKVSRQVLIDGGAKPDRLKPYVMPEEYSNELAVAAYARKKGYHLVGASGYRNLRLQKWDPTTGILTAYVCLDNEKSRIVNAAGRTVMIKGRTQTNSVVLAFAHVSDGPLLQSSSTWSGESVC